jgi:hypothetical protein
VEVLLHAFFDLGTRWSAVVSFTPRLLYPQGESPWYSLCRRLGGLQNLSGRGGEEKKILASTGTRTLDHPKQKISLMKMMDLHSF